MLIYLVYFTFARFVTEYKDTDLASLSKLQVIEVKHLFGLNKILRQSLDMQFSSYHMKLDMNLGTIENVTVIQCLSYYKLYNKGSKIVSDIFLL